MNALNHRDYSGFFPFYLPPYAQEAALGDADGLLRSAALADLVQLFWSAKDAAISYALSGSSTDTETNGDGDTTTTVYSSTLNGSLRASSDVANYAGCLMALPPQSRIGPTNAKRPLIYTDSNYSATYSAGPSGSGTQTTTYSNSDTTNNSSYGPVLDNPLLTWFAILPTVNTAFPVGALSGNVAYDSVAKKYYTRLFIEGIALGPGYSTASDSITDAASVDGITIAIQNRGRSILSGSSFPLYYSPSAARGRSPTVSGTIIINFDTFWE